MAKKPFAITPESFSFSRRYDRARIQPLLVRVQTLAAVLGELPLLPDQAREIEGDLRRGSMHASAALAGNALTPDQAARVLDLPEGAEPPRDPAEREVFNLGRAYRTVTRQRREFGVLEITEPFLQKVHATLAEGLNYPLTEPGRYRIRPVEVGDESQGGSYLPPRHIQDIRLLLPQFLAWINSEHLRREPPVIRAALFGFHFACLHPFDAANQRTGRLLEAMIPAVAGQRFVPWLAAIQDARAPLEAFAAFLESLGARGDLTAFVEHRLRSLAEGLVRVKTRLLEALAGVATRVHLQRLLDRRDISRRQFDLLHVLLASGRDVDLKELLSEAPLRVLYRGKTEHTARRDLHALLDLGCLVRTGRRFGLNPRLLSPPPEPQA